MEKVILTSVKKLLSENTSYRLAKETGLPYQSIQNIKNGKIDPKDAKFKTIIRLYEYQIRLR